MHTRVTINAAATTSRIANAGRPTPVIIADMLLLSCADMLAAASVTLTIVVVDGSSVYSTPQLFANGLLGRGEKIGLIFAAATSHDEYLGADCISYRHSVRTGVAPNMAGLEAATLIANGTFEADDLRIDKNGAAIREDRLRVIDAGLPTLYSANLRMRKGLDAFGASLKATNQGHGFEVTEFAELSYRF